MAKGIEEGKVWNMMSLKALANRALERNAKGISREYSKENDGIFNGENEAKRFHDREPLAYIASTCNCPRCGKSMATYFPKGEVYDGLCSECVQGASTLEWIH